jgi:sugar (pentulose or hexulose) kinase
VSGGSGSANESLRRVGRQTCFPVLVATFDSGVAVLGSGVSVARDIVVLVVITGVTVLDSGLSMVGDIVLVSVSC